MDLGTIDPGLLIVGAVGIIIIVSAYFVGKILVKTQKPKTSVERETVSKKEVSFKEPEWKEKRKFLQRIRSKKERSVDTRPIDKPVTASEIPVTTGPMQDSPVEPMSASLPGAPIAEVPTEKTEIGQKSPEKTTGTDSKADSMNELFADMVKRSEKAAAEKPAETVKEETKKPAKSSGGDIFSMFTDEDEEEDEKTKFAKSLDNVNIDDLLDEVRYLRKCMRR